MGFWEQLRNCDCDNLLSYQTAKVVRIRDKRLGLLHYTFILLIIGYIVGYEVLYNKKYLDLETPIGSVRTSLLKNITRERMSNLSYCSQPGRDSFNGFPTLPCLYWNEGEALYPPTEQTAMFITTRVNITNYTLKCDFTSPNCSYSKINVSSYFIGDIDRFTVLIDHTMYGAKLGLQSNAKNLPGRLMDSNDNQVKDLPSPNVFGQAGQPDILQVKTIVEVAGVNLDQNSTSTPKESNRHAGVLFIVFLTYENTYSFSTNNIRYTMKVREVKDTEFKSVEQVYYSPTEKVERNRHGIRLIFLQTGQLGKFQFQVLLLTVVSGLALLAVSTLVVDLLAVMVLPERKYYEKYKYTDTVDFEKLRHGEVSLGNKSNLEEPLISDEGRKTE